MVTGMAAGVWVESKPKDIHMGQFNRPAKLVGAALTAPPCMYEAVCEAPLPEP